MEWFGLTIYGVPDPIKDIMRPDYVEPTVQPHINEIIAKGSKKTFSELIAELDVYLGTADGYAYRSYDRLLRMRNKGMFKPVGNFYPSLFSTLSNYILIFKDLTICTDVQELT